MRLAALVLGTAAVLLAGCGGSDGGSTEQAAGSTPGTTTRQSSTGTVKCKPAEAHAQPDGTLKRPKLKLDAAKTYKLVFDTNCGSFTVTLNQKAAPNTSASLVSLALKDFFDDTAFPRIVPGFVIQGGDPTGTGTGGPGYKTVDKPPASARYTHGVVAMAKTQAEPAGTSGSQFFVVTGADVGLPPDYAIIGQVTDGLAVVDKIGTLGDPSTEQPTQPVVIKRVRVVS
jgi:cyclophilin family peptidyl-prolyl cis-trans isomerase